MIRILEKNGETNPKAIYTFSICVTPIQYINEIHKNIEVDFLTLKTFRHGN